MEKLIVCPNCYSHLIRLNNKKIKCSKCNLNYNIDNKGVPVLLTPTDKKELNKEIKFTKMYSRKNRVSPFIYKILKMFDKIPIPNLLYNQVNISFKNIINEKSIILNIGGRTESKKKRINLDIIPNKYVNLIGNVERIPLKDRSVDFVNIIAVLHHVKNPHLAVNEIYRVLKKGGHVYAQDHFYYPYHADPRDCHRWTKEGYILLFERFKKVKMQLIHGPTTSVLKMLQIYLPMLFSFNSVLIYEIEYIIFTYILYPFKFLDILLKKNLKADFISGGYAFLGKK